MRNWQLVHLANYAIRREMKPRSVYYNQFKNIPSREPVHVKPYNLPTVRTNVKIVYQE